MDSTGIEDLDDTYNHRLKHRSTYNNIFPAYHNESLPKSTTHEKACVLDGDAGTHNAEVMGRTHNRK